MPLILFILFMLLCLFSIFSLISKFSQFSWFSLFSLFTLFSLFCLFYLCSPLSVFSLWSLFSPWRVFSLISIWETFPCLRIVHTNCNFLGDFDIFFFLQIKQIYQQNRDTFLGQMCWLTWRVFCGPWASLGGRGQRLKFFNLRIVHKKGHSLGTLTHYGCNINNSIGQTLFLAEN